MKNRFILALLIALNIAPFSVYADGLPKLSAELKILWSAPITADPPPDVKDGKSYTKQRGRGLLLSEGAVLSNGHLIFLGHLFDPTSYASVLIENDGKQGIEKNTKIQLEGTRPEPLSFLQKLIGAEKPSRDPTIGTLATDNKDTIWIGGLTNQYMGFASDPHCEAYLAKLDSSANVLWERSYKAARYPIIKHIAPSSNGNLAVVGIDQMSQSSWMASIDSNDGRLIWERYLGNGKDIGIVSTSKDGFIVASFDSTGERAAYQDNVSVRSVSTDGQIGTASVIRQAINKSRGSHFGKIKMSATEDGAYILSNWDESNTTPQQPAEIAKVSADGNLLWSKKLPDSFIEKENRNKTTFCSDPTIASLPNGDGLVACVLDRQIHLYRFNHLTGKEEQGRLPLPACPDGNSSDSLFLVVRKDGAIFLNGSRASNSIGAGCSWIGQLTINHI
ncbi:MAG: hypothetical protein RBT70_08425 [Alphaproteobacteria bacterium]|jgi:hypothetical protein|nr:hypothetical protein [Alphaproteobacteria bacterium]